MVKPWEKDWTVFQENETDREAQVIGAGIEGNYGMPVESAKLAAAAPAMARALCLVEWNFDEFQKPGTGACPCCTFLKPLHYDCELDAALTAAGLTPEDREAVRKREQDAREARIDARTKEILAVMGVKR